MSLYVDDSVPDPTTFGEVRQRAWKIMPREALKSTAQRMSVKPVGKLTMQWQVVDGMTALIRRNLRPLYLSLDLTSMVRDNPWVKALNWLREVFSKSRLFLSALWRSVHRKHFPHDCTRICWNQAKRGKLPG